MNIAVCVKQVPDTADLRLDPDTNTLIREGVAAILNPLDEFPLEAALRLRPDVMGTRDGLSKTPYIRESRRIVPLKRIVAGEILAAGRDGARAEPFSDSIGVGWYYMDLHPAVGNPRSMFEPTLPYQVPLGALIPQRTTNLLAACKNIGTTHLSNGAYRLHPVEWNIGESAGALVAFCLRQKEPPRQVRRVKRRLAEFQRLLSETMGLRLQWPEA